MFEITQISKKIGKKHVCNISRLFVRGKLSRTMRGVQKRIPRIKGERMGVQPIVRRLCKLMCLGKVQRSHQSVHRQVAQRPDDGTPLSCNSHGLSRLGAMLQHLLARLVEGSSKRLQDLAADSLTSELKN
jgi:hypothetical protein